MLYWIDPMVYHSFVVLIWWDSLFHWEIDDKLFSLEERKQNNWKEWLTKDLHWARRRASRIFSFKNSSSLILGLVSISFWIWARNSSSSVSTPLRSRCRIGLGLSELVEIFGVSSVEAGVWWIFEGSSRLLTIKITSWGWDGARYSREQWRDRDRQFVYYLIETGLHWHWSILNVRRNSTDDSVANDGFV